MEEQYKEMRDRHHLPDYAVLDKDFEISTIEEEEFLLRNIRKKIVDKIDSAIKLFDDLLHPESNFSSYRESNTFSDSDREGMVALYKRMMYFNRFSTELSFSDSDEANAKFINDFIREWPELKKSVIYFVRRMKESWQKDILKKEFVGYFG